MWDHDNAVVGEAKSHILLRIVGVRLCQSFDAGLQIKRRCESYILAGIPVVIHYAELFV